ncbi:hypothetical protein KFK09_022917 [Dendrobium nobile]|uniref:Uncharacterized protein n=1 Tax=Dendrobium nobile TaxID=94219 RepID=A0A8T3AK06_DENNO|nr:hypothetical protein KFK09_022917 [Dendrobium nobile]
MKLFFTQSMLSESILFQTNLFVKLKSISNFIPNIGFKVLSLSILPNSSWKGVSLSLNIKVFKNIHEFVTHKLHIPPTLLQLPNYRRFFLSLAPKARENSLIFSPKAKC